MSDTVVESELIEKTLDIKKLKVAVVQLTSDKHPSLEGLYKVRLNEEGTMIKGKYHHTVVNRLRTLKTEVDKFDTLRLHLLFYDTGTSYRQMIVILSEMSDKYALDNLEHRIGMRIKILDRSTYHKAIRHTKDWISFDISRLDESLLEYSIEYGVHETSWVVELLEIFDKTRDYNSNWETQVRTRRYLPTIDGDMYIGRDIHDKPVRIDTQNILYVGSEDNLGQIASRLPGVIILSDNPQKYRLKKIDAFDISVDFLGLVRAHLDLGYSIMRYWQMLVDGRPRDVSDFIEMVLEIIAQGLIEDVNLEDFLADDTAFDIWGDLSSSSNRQVFQSKYVEIFSQLNFNSYSEELDEIRRGSCVIDISQMGFLEGAALSIMLMVLKEAGYINSWLVLPNFESRMGYDSKYKINSVINLIDTSEMMFYSSNPAILSNSRYKTWRSDFTTLIVDTINLKTSNQRSLGIDHIRYDGLVVLNHNNHPTVLRIEDYKFKETVFEHVNLYNREYAETEAEVEQSIEVIGEVEVMHQHNYSALCYLNHSYEVVEKEDLMDDLLLVDLELSYLSDNNLIKLEGNTLMITPSGRKIVRQLIDNLKMSDETRIAKEERGEHYLITDLRVRINETDDREQMIGILMDIILLAGEIETYSMKPIFSILLGLLANIYTDRELDIKSIPKEVGFHLKILQDMVSEGETEIIDALTIDEDDLLDEKEEEEIETLHLDLGGKHPWQRMSSDEYLKNTLLKGINTGLDTDVLRAYLIIRDAAIADSISRDYLIDTRMVSKEQLDTLIDAGLLDSYNNTVDIRELDLNKLIEIEQRLESHEPESIDPCVSDAEDIIVEDRLNNIPGLSNIPTVAKTEPDQITEPEEESLLGSQVLETREELEGIYRILCYYHLNNRIESSDEIGISNAKQKGLIVGNGSLDLTNRGREIIIKDIMPAVNGVLIDLDDIKVDDGSLDDLRVVLLDIVVHLMKTDNVELMSSSLSLFKTLDRYRDVSIDDDGSFITHVRQSVQLYLSKIIVDRGFESNEIEEATTAKAEDKIEDSTGEEITEIVTEDRIESTGEIDKIVDEKIVAAIEVPEDQSEQKIEANNIKLNNLKGIGPKMAISLEKRRLFTVYDIATLINPVDELVDISGIGIKTANKIIDLVSEIKLSGDPTQFMRDPSSTGVVEQKKIISDILRFGPDVLGLVEKLLLGNIAADPSIMLGKLLIFIIKQISGKTVELKFKELITKFNKIGTKTGVRTTDITVDYTGINNLWTDQEAMRENLMHKFKDRLFAVVGKFSYNDEFVKELLKLNEF